MIFLCLLIAALPAEKEISADERAQQQQKRKEIEGRAESQVRGVLGAMCAGRCELLEVHAEIGLKRSVKDALPGFEQLSKEEVEYPLRALNVTVAADTKLAPSARSGLQAAIQNAMEKFGAPATVTLKAFEFPSARPDAPIVLQVNSNDMTKKEPAPAPLPPPPPPPEETLTHRFLSRMIDASPWLLGLLIMLMGVGRIFGRKPERPLPQIETPVIRVSALAASPMLERAFANRALAVHTARALLEDFEPAEAAKYIQWIPVSALDDATTSVFATPELALRLQAVLAAARQAQPAQHPEALEQLTAQLIGDCQHDPRLWFLPALADVAFVLTIDDAPEQSRASILAHAPGRLRKRFFADEALELRASLAVADLDDAAVALVQKGAEHACKASRQLDSFLRDAADKISTDATLRAKVERMHSAWAELFDAIAVKEESLLAAPIELWQKLVYAVPAGTLIDYLAGAKSAIRERVDPLLPKYLQASLQGAPQPDPARFAAVQRELFAAFQSLAGGSEREQRARVSLLRSRITERAIRVIASVLLLFVASCTYLTIRPRTGEPQVIEVPVDTGPNGQTFPECPVEATAQRKTAQIVAFVRLDKGLTALAPRIEAQLLLLWQAIASRGVVVSHVLVSAYEDDGGAPLPMYFASCAANPPKSMSEILRSFSTRAPDVRKSQTCELAQVANEGALFETMQARYSPELQGDVEPPRDAPFFSAPPTYTLVLFFDHGSRERSLDACGDAAPRLRADWLHFPAGSADPKNVFFASIATSETGETYAQMAERCAKSDGFPQETLDVMVPSAAAQFSPFADASAAHASAFDMCEIYSSGGEQKFFEVLVRIHKALNLPLDPYGQ